LGGAHGALRLVVDGRQGAQREHEVSLELGLVAVAVAVLGQDASGATATEVDRRTGRANRVCIANPDGPNGPKLLLVHPVRLRLLFFQRADLRHALRLRAYELLPERAQARSLLEASHLVARQCETHELGQSLKHLRC